MHLLRKYFVPHDKLYNQRALRLCARMPVPKHIVSGGEYVISRDQQERGAALLKKINRAPTSKGTPVQNITIVVENTQQRDDTIPLHILHELYGR